MKIAVHFRSMHPCSIPLAMVLLACGPAEAAQDEPTVLPEMRVTRDLTPRFVVSHPVLAKPPRQKLVFYSIDRLKDPTKTAGLIIFRTDGAKDNDEIVEIEGKPVATMTDIEWKKLLLGPEQAMHLVLRNSESAPPRTIQAERLDTHSRKK